MYCPKCGVETLNEAKFCRACGTDVSLVPLAVTGKLASATLPGQPTPKEAAQLSKAITNAFTGVAFVLIAFCVLFFAPAGRLWWFWMFIPAFALLGSAIAEYVRFKVGARSPLSAPESRPFEAINPPQEQRLPPASFTGSVQPPSVTEDTTRHLDARPPRQEEGR